MAGRVRVSVYDAAIASMFLPGGDCWDFARRMGREMEDIAVWRCPVRTGEMKRRHGHVETPVGRNSCRTTLYNDSDHALYVHNGTGPVIFGKPLMIVRPSPYSYYSQPTPRYSVRGQKANPWLRESMMDILARYGL